MISHEPEARFVVIRAGNPAGLARGTRLLEVRQFEHWDHQGCIPSIRTLLVEFRVLDGERAGEVISEVLEQGYEDDPPWSGPRPDWFAREHPLPPMDPSDPAVVHILERAARLTIDEATALAAAVRAEPDLVGLARAALDEHQAWLNSWAMFDHWADPTVEMADARRRVETALGVGSQWWGALVPDDGSVAWGAATAAALAVLGSGRAVSGRPRFREPWERVLGDGVGRPAGSETPP